MEHRKPDIGKTRGGACWIPEVSSVCEPDTTDELTQKSFMLQWQWNANYDDSWYET